MEPETMSKKECNKKNCILLWPIYCFANKAHNYGGNKACYKHFFFVFFSLPHSQDVSVLVMVGRQLMLKNGWQVASSFDTAVS